MTHLPSTSPAPTPSSVSDPHSDRPDLLVAALHGLVGEIDDSHVGRLRREFASTARREGLVDVAYRIVDSPIGALLLAATPIGVVRVAFDAEGHDAVLDTLASTVSPRLLRDDAALDAPARQLDEFFARRRTRFDVALDHRLTTGFRLDVLDALATIPYGSTLSYAQLAAIAGRPAAVRAAASACSHNPLPLLLPCHRIVRADGSPGEYLGGPAAKRQLLALESG